MLSRAPVAQVKGYYCCSGMVIATAPKVGTTWIQQIVCLLVFQSAEPKPLHQISPWLGFWLRDNLDDMRA